MTVSVGKIEYTLGAAPVIGTGVSWSTTDLDKVLAGPAAAIVFDDSGTADINALLSGLSETEFNSDAVKSVLSNSKEPENWRVGEALAEAYLAHNKNCSFPWPDGRDERKSGSSLPGADLVGFHSDGTNDRFAFGEVKTSSEAKYPPGTMHGKTGLKQQLEDLRNKPDIRNDLVKYLAHRATIASWKQQFQRAFVRYNNDDCDVRSFGVMVRDVTPHEDDLKARVNKLGKGCPQNMEMDLLAIYLPQDSISNLSKKVVASRKGGQA